MGFYLTVEFLNLIAFYKTFNSNGGLNQFTAEEFFNFTGSFGWVVIKGNKIQGNFSDRYNSCITLFFLVLSILRSISRQIEQKLVILTNLVLIKKCVMDNHLGDGATHYL